MVKKIDEINKKQGLMSKYLISVIIPVYNCGKYLKPMLESIYAQTYPHIEVIAAYDTKSKDDSFDILQEYAEEHGLIIDQAQDTSSGCARNRGFRLAKGDFVIFLDGDDLIVPTYLENLMAVFIKNPELNVVCGSFSLADEKNVEQIYKKCLASKTSSVVYELDEALERWLPAKKYLPNETLFSAPWTWLLRRNFLLKHNIVFPDYSHSEDQLYTGKLIVNSEKIGYTKKKGYVWIMHETSTLHKYRTYDECFLQEKKFISDMTLVLAEKHSNILARFNAIRRISFNKGYIMGLWGLPYAEFIAKLQEKNLMHLEYAESESLVAHMSTFCFNHFKRLYLFIHRRFRYGWK